MKNNAENSVIFSINYHPFLTRNLFDTGVMDRIAGSAKALVVFVPLEKEKVMKERYEKGNLTIVGINLEQAITTRKNTLFIRTAELLLNTRAQHFDQLILFAKLGSRFKYYTARIVTKISSFFWPLRPIFRIVDRTFNPSQGVFDEYFKKYTPTTVFATDLFDPYNTELIKAAEKHNVRTVGMLRSWDNTTTKHYLRTVPSLVLAHNELERAELKKYHEVALSRVVLVGVPQFEKYLTYTPISREEFCKKLGIDPNRRILLFTPVGKAFTDTDWQICEILKELYDSKKVPEDVHFLIRPHPQVAPDLSKFIPNEHVTIDIPKTLQLRGGYTGIELDVGAAEHLADTLAHSSMLLGVCSSIIVEAAIFNKPAITIAFNGWERDVPFVRSVDLILQEEWPAATFGKVSPLVKNKEELAHWINRYLDNPELDQEKRKVLVKDHCYKFDGDAAQRTEEAIFSFES